jgi:hypothetical protein
MCNTLASKFYFLNRIKYNESNTDDSTLNTPSVSEHTNMKRRTTRTTEIPDYVQTALKRGLF